MELFLSKMNMCSFICELSLIVISILVKPMDDILFWLKQSQDPEDWQINQILMEAITMATINTEKFVYVWASRRVALYDWTNNLCKRLGSWFSSNQKMEAVENTIAFLEEYFLEW